MNKLGWSSYLRKNKRFSWSLSCTETIWSPRQRIRYDVLTQRNWDSRQFVARPLTAAWRGKLLPVIATSCTRLVIAAGSLMQSFVFSLRHRDAETSDVHFETTYTIKRTDTDEKPNARHDITGISFLPDNGRDRTLLAGFADGCVMQIELPEKGEKYNRDAATGEIAPLVPTIQKLYWDEDSIEGLSVSKDLSITISNSNLAKATLRNTSSEQLQQLELDARGWSTFVSTASSPYAAFGTSSRRTPLAIHAITEAALDPTPSYVLSSIGRSKDSSTDGVRESSAVYGICNTPPSFPGSASGKTLVAGWFDGFVRVYDLRVSPSSSITVHKRSNADAGANTNVPVNNDISVPVFKPVLSMCDPWSTEPIYTVATGGAAGHTIAAGSARHSVVSFWDVRNPREGWSVHAPGNDSSPVYSIAMESSRLFGATQSRSFVLDFGPGVDMDTYTPVPHSGGRLDNALKTTNGIHYQVTRYMHRNPMSSG